jgi:hypothetical protein
MNKYLGIALLVAGAMMIVFGIQSADSFDSDVSRFFTGSPTDKSMWLLIGGAVAAIVGFFMTTRKTLKA